MSNKILNLDLAKDNTLPAIIYGRIADDRLQTVTVNITRRSEPVDLTGYTITFEGVTHEEQTQIFDSDNVSTTSAGLKKGTFDYTFPNMAFAVAGKYEQAYFSIVKDGKRDTTGDFEILVLSNADINAAEAETIITEYNKLVAELNEIQKDNIADLQEQQDTYIQSTDKTFAAIQGRITNLQNTIKGFETSVNDTATDVLSTVNQALEELKAGDFYTQLEADARFAKTEDMSAHTENISNPHKVTKTQIGLGNVDNYSTATQAEAESGTDTNKFMTPATTAQAIDNRAVTLASNQTVGGIKNFKDGLQVAGKNLVRTNGLESAYANKGNTPEAFSDGALNLYRKGDMVFLTGSIKLSAGKNNQGIWFNLPVWAKPVNMVRLFFRSTNGNMVLLTYDPTTYDALICADNVAKDQWLIGSGTWLAKDSY